MAKRKAHSRMAQAPLKVEANKVMAVNTVAALLGHKELVEVAATQSHTR